jgi:hypothetical protein
LFAGWFIVVLFLMVLYYFVDMMLRGFDGRIRGAQPELLIKIQSGVTGNIESLAAVQLPGQALAVTPRSMAPNRPCRAEVIRETCVPAYRTGAWCLGLSPRRH